MRPSFSPSADRRSLLDRAHRGDVVGALGRLPSVDSGPRRSTRRRVVALLAIMGPGVIVMTADNDAGGISTYAQAGQDFGLRFLWLVIALAGVLLVNQEMVGRLGAVTGAGHARLIYERFGRRWGSFALGDLLFVNFLVIVTEFIGIALGLGYFGVSRYVSVPLAALALIVLPITGSFRRWERAMYVFVAASFAAVPLLAFVHHGADLSTLAAVHPHIASEGTRPRRDSSYRHDRRALAAVLSAVQCGRQANHSPMAPLRTRRDGAGCGALCPCCNRCVGCMRAGILRHPAARRVHRCRHCCRGTPAPRWSLGGSFVRRRVD